MSLGLSFQPTNRFPAPEDPRTAETAFLSLRIPVVSSFGKMDALKTVTAEASKLEHSIEHQLTILWHELQEWQKDNHFIYSGYRPASNSYVKSWMRYALVPPPVT